MNAKDYLQKYRHLIQYDAIDSLQQERAAWRERPSCIQFESVLNTLPSHPVRHKVYDQDMVEIGAREEWNQAEHGALVEALKVLIPWRKGPFKVFGVEIDAEWLSDWKWQRVRPVLPDLKGKRVADIGANNGYYMFRMVPHEPECVIGFEPNLRYWYTFEFLQKYAQEPNLAMELLGVEHMELFTRFFDVVFCMGIVYHHENPIGLLKGILQSMRKGGTLIMESMGIPGDASMALFPEKRYAKVPGTWFVPTLPCLLNWMHRAGFREVQAVHSLQLTTSEQRSTFWSPNESLSDFLNPEDPSLTVEGLPAPWRFVATGVKP